MKTSRHLSPLHLILPCVARSFLRSSWRAVSLCSALCVPWATPAFAQSYSITSRAIAAGGGASNGGQYSVEGAIAQREASAASTGGAYSISGGFFAQYMALQQTGAPRLVIRPNGANVQIVWGANVPGWKLQTNTADLSSASWVDVAGTPTVSGAEQYHAFVAGGGRVFFRLRKL